MGVRDLAVPRACRACSAAAAASGRSGSASSPPCSGTRSISVVASAAVLVALALPAADLKLGLAPADYGMSKNLPVMQAKAAIDKAFPGSPSPAVVVIEAKDVTAPQVDAGDRELRADGRRERARVQALHAAGLAGPHGRAALRADQGRRPQRPRPWPRCRRCATRSCRRRSTRAAGITQATVAGEAAGVEDFNQVMRDRAPLVIGFVLLLSFLLLLVTFRSLIVPIKAIVLNLLSVGAAYGILVAVFQHSWARGHPRVRERRRDRVVAPDLPLRRALRTLDGLPRVHPQPGARAVGAGRPDRRRPSSRASPRRPAS